MALELWSCCLAQDHATVRDPVAVIDSLRDADESIWSHQSSISSPEVLCRAIELEQNA